jgi:tetratricopeptide (TPR) repeat protein
MGRRAHLELEQGAVDSARERLQEALALRRGLDDRRGVGLALAGLGRVETAAGDHDAAERHLAEARDLFRRAGDRWGLASTLWRTADLAFARDRVDDAEAALLEARAALGETARDRWIAHTVAEVALLRGDDAAAAARFAEARRRYASTGDGLGTDAVDERLGSLQRAR